MKLRTSSTLLGFVVLVVALVLAGNALAQTPAPAPAAPAATPSPQAQFDYHDFYMNDLAKNLGVTRSQLDAALTKARDDTVDQAVANGDLTQKHANQIKSQPATGPFGFGFHHMMRGPGGGYGGAGAPSPNPTPGP